MSVQPSEEGNAMSKKSRANKAAAAQAGAGDSITLAMPEMPEMDDAAALIGGPKAAAKVAAKVAKLAVVAAKKEKVLRPTCPETKKDGTPCTARCAEGKQTCVDHQPAWDRLTHEEHVAFGGWLRKAKAADIVDVIGWWKAKQIAADHQAENPATTEQVKIR